MDVFDCSSNHTIGMVRAEYRRVYGFAFHLTRDEHRAADLTQETFRVACEKWASFDRRSSAATWLHRIAYRKFVDEYRTRASRCRVEQERVAREAKSAVGPETAVQIKHDVLAAVDQLDDDERVVIVMRYFQQLSVAEVAAITEQPSGTIKWRTREALVKLRRLLAAEVDE